MHRTSHSRQKRPLEDPGPSWSQRLWSGSGAQDVQSPAIPGCTQHHASAWSTPMLMPPAPSGQQPVTAPSPIIKPALMASKTPDPFTPMLMPPEQSEEDVAKVRCSPPRESGLSSDAYLEAEGVVFAGIRKHLDPHAHLRRSPRHAPSRGEESDSDDDSDVDSDIEGSEDEDGDALPRPGSYDGKAAWHDSEDHFDASGRSQDRKDQRLQRHSKLTSCTPCSEQGSERPERAAKLSEIARAKAHSKAVEVAFNGYSCRCQAAAKKGDASCLEQFTKGELRQFHRETYGNDDDNIRSAAVLQSIHQRYWNLATPLAEPWAEPNVWSAL